MSELQQIVYKLSCDTKRYVEDFRLNSRFKLFFIVDYWPVLLFRLEEISKVSGVWGKILALLLVPIRPILRGLSGGRISSSAIIDGGLLLHVSQGVVIGADTRIGKNCTFHTGVVVAHKGDGKGLSGPVVGDDVFFFSGCKVLGPVHIGNNAKIAANAVVLHDVPDNMLAVGVPARNIVQKSQR